MLATSAIGWTTPDSLLASITETSGRLDRDSARQSASRSRTPPDVTGSTSTCPASKRPPLSTDGCSIAEINSRSRGSRRPPISMAGVRAKTFASVAPLVKVTFLLSAPTSLATSSRACSIRRRAARPSAWTEDALPVSARAAHTASRASSRRGAVAFQSKYARSAIILGHYSLTVFGPGPAKSLLFALRVVVEARNYPALIACVAAGDSGNHIIRIIINYLYRFVKVPPERNKILSPHPA